MVKTLIYSLIIFRILFYSPQPFEFVWVVMLLIPPPPPLHSAMVNPPPQQGEEGNIRYKYLMSGWQDKKDNILLVLD